MIRRWWRNRRAVAAAKAERRYYEARLGEALEELEQARNARPCRSSHPGIRIRITFQAGITADDRVVEERHVLSLYDSDLLHCKAKIHGRGPDGWYDWLTTTDGLRIEVAAVTLADWALWPADDDPPLTVADLIGSGELDRIERLE